MGDTLEVQKKKNLEFVRPLFHSPETERTAGKALEDIAGKLRGLFAEEKFRDLPPKS